MSLHNSLHLSMFKDFVLKLKSAENTKLKWQMFWVWPWLFQYTAPIWYTAPIKNFIIQRTETGQECSLKCLSWWKDINESQQQFRKLSDARIRCVSSRFSSIFALEQGPLCSASTTTLASSLRQLCVITASTVSQHQIVIDRIRHRSKFCKVTVWILWLFPNHFYKCWPRNMSEATLFQFRMQFRLK